ncbi:uncharacterized protein DUF4019 [Nitrosomonas sp. Nm84]|uniref:DUF4019 domain-containing protein n=1 Tax=Nitrosomonas sp. Nm84 TaxID=200124 RepID=UPI000D759AD2|nr:DUF4019 domain-containing protein [Nitrosomonas sp. Nm84]PXW86779.1 uncharacterized protein DUF4019 [Nitrosomonas sp. Nm84]
MIKRLMAVLLLLLCVGVVYAEESNIIEKVESSARAWLEGVDSGKYKESWENSSALFKTKTSELEWIKSITALRASRGTVSARYIATAAAAKSLSGLPDGEYIVLQFYATFTEKGLALETVTLVKTHNEIWQVVDYSMK